jgi:hypothetical protein
MVVQAGIIALALLAGIGSTRWRVGGALGEGAALLYAGMACFAIGHVAAFVISWAVPTFPSWELFLMHHGGALIALALISASFWRVRWALGQTSGNYPTTFLVATLPFIAICFLGLAAVGHMLPVPGAPSAPMGGGMGGMGGMNAVMGGTDAMRELENGVTLGNVGVDGAIFCAGLLAVGLGSGIDLGGALGRSLRISLIGITALALVYPGTTLATAFQPSLTAWLEMALCFTVSCAFVIFVASISAARVLGTTRPAQARAPQVLGQARPPRVRPMYPSY